MVKKLKMKHSFCSLYKMNCPNCDSSMSFIHGGKIDVNVETEGRIEVPRMFTLFKTCNNPLCEWSKVKEK